MTDQQEAGSLYMSVREVAIILFNENNSGTRRRIHRLCDSKYLLCNIVQEGARGCRRWILRETVDEYIVAAKAHNLKRHQQAMRRRVHEE